MALELDESFKRPGTVPFKWEVQPGIPKQQDAAGDVPPPPTSPRLALPPAARVGAPLAAPQTSHRRSMSARFATSLALMPFVTRRGRGGGGGRAGAGNCEDAEAESCLLYGDKAA